jgi:hypothetical protein
VSVLAIAFSLSIKAILGGEFVPQRATWAGWALIDVVLAYSSYKLGGVSDPTFVLGVTYLVGAAIVFLLSLKWGKGGTSPFDISCFLLAAIGGVASYTYGMSSFGLVISVAALWLAGAPNLVSAYVNPQEESLTLWWLILLAIVLSIVRVTHWERWQNYLFPVSDFAYTVSLLFIVHVRTWMLKR